MTTYTNEDIVRYVDDEMSLEEKQKMEEDLRTNAALAENVALYRQMKGVLQERLPDEGAAALRQTLGGQRGKYFGGGAAGGGSSGGGIDTGSFSAETPGSGARVVKMVLIPRKYIVGVAAAAAILFAVVLLWPSDYLSKYGKTEMVGTTERGEGNDSLMEQASVYFNNGEFAKALPLLDQAYGKDTSNQTALFYRGVAYLHLKDARAGKDLERVYNGGSLFKYEAAFYIALGYAQQGDKASAFSWLEKIPAGAPGADKAAGLRRKLE